MPIIRSTGREVLVRYAGRRVRIGADWSEVSDDAMDKVIEEGGDSIEFKPSSPPPSEKSNDSARKSESKKSEAPKKRDEKE